MNICTFYHNGILSVSCECIKGYAFKNAVLWVKSALLPVICSGFGSLRDHCVHFFRIECLLPHRIFA